MTSDLATYAIAAKSKVSLSLRVVGLRPDGFHDLDAVTVSATDPDDIVTIGPRARAGIGIRVRPTGAAPSDATNLAWRAAKALLPELPVRGLRVHLEKNIPAGAGLGGGSYDAAAVLNLLGSHYEIPAARLLELGADLGADVPFCLQRLPARMRGRGEVLEAITGLPPLDLVIVAPRFGCSTPAVYRTWDELGAPRSERSIEAPAGYPGPFVNDLEPAAEHLEPRLRSFRERLEVIIGRPALLCGSGSAYAAWFDDPDACDDAAHRARVAFGSARAWRARTIHE
jgi:4-diphosphocytidyl-2-C-methyl-D-erythritol kinase